MQSHCRALPRFGERTEKSLPRRFTTPSRAIRPPTTIVRGVEPEPDVDVDDDQQSVDDDSDKKKRKEMSERKKRARNRPESIEGNKSSAKEVVVDDGDVASESSEEGLRYKIQFLTSGKPLSKKSKEFKGLKNVDSYRDGGLHKYTVGNYKSMDDAEKELRKVRAKFPRLS